MLLDLDGRSGHFVTKERNERKERERKEELIACRKEGIIARHTPFFVAPFIFNFSTILYGQ